MEVLPHRLRGHVDNRGRCIFHLISLRNDSGKLIQLKKTAYRYQLTSHRGSGGSGVLARNARELLIPASPHFLVRSGPSRIRPGRLSSQSSASCISTAASPKTCVQWLRRVNRSGRCALSSFERGPAGHRRRSRKVLGVRFAGAGSRLLPSPCGPLRGGDGGGGARLRPFRQRNLVPPIPPSLSLPARREGTQGPCRNVVGASFAGAFWGRSQARAANCSRCGVPSREMSQMQVPSFLTQ